ALYAAGASNIIVSVDSFDPEVYKKQRGVLFRHVYKALDALNHFTSLDPENFGVVTIVVTKNNYKELPEFIRHIDEYGRKRILSHSQPYHRPPDVEAIPEQVRSSITDNEWKIYEALKAQEGALLPDES